MEKQTHKTSHREGDTASHIESCPGPCGCLQVIQNTAGNSSSRPEFRDFCCSLRYLYLEYLL